jgi:hypothetical protein
MNVRIKSNPTESGKRAQKKTASCDGLLGSRCRTRQFQEKLRDGSAVSFDGAVSTAKELVQQLTH